MRAHVLKQHRAWVAPFTRSHKHVDECGGVHNDDEATVVSLKLAQEAMLGYFKHRAVLTTDIAGSETVAQPLLRTASGCREAPLLGAGVQCSGASSKASHVDRF